jgi:predicted lipoprotein with Yx(FWY)xxD motif
VRLPAGRTRLVAPTILLVGILATGCGGGSNSPALSSKAGPGSSGPVGLKTAKVSGLGTVVVDSRGRTLYTFAPDKARKVTCTGSCASVWSPVKVASGHKPTLSGAIKASLVSTASDPSGGTVVTYRGWPLYDYAADTGPGMAQGQALNSSGGLWYVITPSGQLIKKRGVAGSNTGKNYCLSVTTQIAAPHGAVQVNRIRPGMVVWSADRHGRRIRVTVLKVHHTRVASDHLMVRLHLADGRKLLVSLGHPLPNGEPIRTLAAGRRFEGSRVVSAARVRYGRPYTYDLLPAGATHTYFADGVLLGSTLAP